MFQHRARQRVLRRWPAEGYPKRGVVGQHWESAVEFCNVGLLGSRVRNFPAQEAGWLRRPPNTAGGGTALVRSSERVDISFGGKPGPGTKFENPVRFGT